VWNKDAVEVIGKAPHKKQASDQHKRNQVIRFIFFHLGLIFLQGNFFRTNLEERRLFFDKHIAVWIFYVKHIAT
jgi:hypothetical protein